MLSKAHNKLIADLLEIAEEEFAGHVSNDIDLPYSEENLRIVTEMIAAGDYPTERPNIHGEHITVSNIELMAHLRSLLVQEMEVPLRMAISITCEYGTFTSAYGPATEKDVEDAKKCLVDNLSKLDTFSIIEEDGTILVLPKKLLQDSLIRLLVHHVEVQP